MPGFTAPDGFIYEVPGDQPLISLTSGTSGTFPILAEQVQTKITDLEGNVIAGIDSRLTVAEAAAAASVWRGLGSGVESGAAFDIPVPAGFEILRLHLFGDLDGNGTVRLRINGDATAGLHNTAMVTETAESPPVLATTFSTNATAWFLANWGTVSGNTVEATIWCLNASGAPVYRSVGVRMSANDNGMIESRCRGFLDADRTVSSLSVRPFSDVSNLFATCHWRLEGRITP